MSASVSEDATATASQSSAATASPAAVDSSTVVADIAAGLSRLMHSYNRVRNQVLAAARQNVEWSAHLLIAQLVVEGPLRSSALADLVKSDPSTVSRQVAALVQDGLIERRADPDDGRASLLVATARGQAIYRAHEHQRTAHFARLLSEWSEADRRDFSRLINRFIGDFETYRPRFFDTDPLETPTTDSHTEPGAASDVAGEAVAPIGDS